MLTNHSDSAQKTMLKPLSGFDLLFMGGLRMVVRFGYGLCALGILCSCEKKDTMRTYEEVFVSAFPPQRIANGVESTPEVSKNTRAAKTLRWTKPESWEEQEGSGMRLATFLVRVEGMQVECTVVSFPGQVGGVEANVKRWIGQVGLSPPSESEYQAFISRQSSFVSEGGFPGLLIDFESLPPLEQKGPQVSMLACIVSIDDHTVFVKMTADTEFLRIQKKNFELLCRSLRQE